MASHRAMLLALAVLQLSTTMHAIFLKVHNASKAGNIKSEGERSVVSDNSTGNHVHLLADDSNDTLGLSTEESIEDEDRAAWLAEKADYEAVTQQEQSGEKSNEKNNEEEDTSQAVDVDVDEEAKEIQGEDAEVIAEGEQDTEPAVQSDADKQPEAKATPRPVGKLASKRDQSALSIATAIEQHDDLGESGLRLVKMVTEWAQALGTTRQTKEKADAVREAEQRAEEDLDMEMDEASKEVLEEDAQAMAEDEQIRLVATKTPSDKLSNQTHMSGLNDMVESQVGALDEDAEVAAAEVPSKTFDNHTQVSAPIDDVKRKADVSKVVPKSTDSSTPQSVHHSKGKSVLSVARKGTRQDTKHEEDEDEHEDDEARGGVEYNDGQSGNGEEGTADSEEQSDDSENGEDSQSHDTEENAQSEQELGNSDEADLSGEESVEDSFSDSGEDEDADSDEQ